MRSDRVYNRPHGIGAYPANTRAQVGIIAHQYRGALRTRDMLDIVAYAVDHSLDEGPKQTFVS